MPEGVPAGPVLTYFSTVQVRPDGEADLSGDFLHTIVYFWALAEQKKLVYTFSL